LFDRRGDLVGHQDHGEVIVRFPAGEDPRPGQPLVAVLNHELDLIEESIHHHQH
jgi:hypothetical protein